VVEKFKVVKENPYFPLLKFLVREGKIDETYRDYMTYFYPNSLSVNDAAFCRSVTDQKAKPADYCIEKPGMVVNRLPSWCFSQIEVFNHSLFNYLLKEKNPSVQLTLLVEKLTEIKPYDFIRGYFTKENEQEEFVAVINQKWFTLFSELLSCREADDNQLLTFALYTVYHAKKNTIIAVNSGNCLSDYISSNSAFLKVSSPRVERIISGLIQLGVSFVSIDSDGAHPELLRGVYENNLYRITIENISIMLQEFYKLEKGDAFAHRNYSLVLSEPNSPLASYVNDNLTDYFTEILKHCGNIITDDESISHKVLNNENIPLDLKESYVSMLRTRLRSLEDVTNEELWGSLLDNDAALLYSEENVIAYWSYAGCEFDEALTVWVNRQESQLDFSGTELFKDNIDTLEEFLDSVVICNSLDNVRYNEFSSSIGIEYVEFEFESIEDDKMMILIENNLIFMNSENITFIRNNYSFNILCHFIIHGIDEYITLLEQENSLLDEKELQYVISTESGVLEDLQIRLLQLCDGELSINKKQYSEGVVLYILKNNFLEDDLSFFLRDFDDFSPGVKNVICDLLIERIDYVIEAKLSISRALFEQIVSMNKLTNERIVCLLVLALPSIGEHGSIRYLNMYGFNQFADIFDKNKKPQFDYTKFNIFILDCFVQWGKIKEHNVREDGKIHIKR